MVLCGVSTFQLTTGVGESLKETSRTVYIFSNMDSGMQYILHLCIYNQRKDLEINITPSQSMQPLMPTIELQLTNGVYSELLYFTSRAGSLCEGKFSSICSLSSLCSAHFGIPSGTSIALREQNIWQLAYHVSYMVHPTTIHYYFTRTERKTHLGLKFSLLFTSLN